PEVSYKRTLGSPPDSATSRNGTPSTWIFREPGNAPRVISKAFELRMGLFIRTSPYAGLNRIRFKGTRGIAISAVRRPWDSPTIAVWRAAQYPSAAPKYVS